MRRVETLLLCIVMGCGPSASSIDGGGGGDGGSTCVGSETRCVGSTFQQCVDGTFTVQEQCTTVCDTTLGCIDCYAGLNHCYNGDVYSCTDAGDRGSLVQECNDLECVSGTCVDPCAAAAANRSYIGCEYMAVDLDNAVEVLGPVILLGCDFDYGAGVLTSMPVCWNGSATAGLCDPPADGCPAGYTCQTQSVCVLNAQKSPFAVVVSNPSNNPATVTITNQAGTSREVTVNGNAVKEIFPLDLGFPDASVDHSGISAKAYKITSNRPIVAYQFNPLDNVDVFSNDGSLLIPRTTWDTAYYAMSYPTLTRRPDTNDYNSYVAVVAWEDGTEVAVTPSADVRAGAGFAAIVAGTTTNFTLDAFEVLNLESVQGPAQGHEGGPDLTGTKVEAVNGTDVFGVFGGHEAIVIPTAGGSCCADHIEEMMFPTSTWGVDYAIARSQDRGSSEPDMIRVMAQNDGTTITFNPAPAEGTCSTLAAGGFCEVMISVDTEISGNDNPILVGHYLVSNINTLSGTGTGDPAMALGVPTEQFRTSYIFLVPSQYAENYVSIVAPAGATVTLDGVAVTGLTAMGSGAFAAKRESVAAGQQHTIECPDGCGIEVYGYDDAVSYLFAGGLDLEQIVVD